MYVDVLYFCEHPWDSLEELRKSKNFDFHSAPNIHTLKPMCTVKVIIYNVSEKDCLRSLYHLQNTISFHLKQLQLNI